MWSKLQKHHSAVANRRIETMLDAARAADFVAHTGDMRLDYAKTNIDADGRAFVRSVVPIACGASHTAWQIGISEVQRQAIYKDPQWQAGRGRLAQADLGCQSVKRQAPLY